MSIASDIVVLHNNTPQVNMASYPVSSLLEYVKWNTNFHPFSDPEHHALVTVPPLWPNKQSCVKMSQRTRNLPVFAPIYFDDDPICFVIKIDDSQFNGLCMHANVTIESLFEQVFDHLKQEGICGWEFHGIRRMGRKEEERVRMHILYINLTTEELQQYENYYLWTSIDDEDDVVTIMNKDRNDGFHHDI